MGNRFFYLLFLGKFELCSLEITLACLKRGDKSLTLKQIYRSISPPFFFLFFSPPYFSPAKDWFFLRFLVYQKCDFIDLYGCECLKTKVEELIT